MESKSGILGGLFPFARMNSTLQAAVNNPKRGVARNPHWDNERASMTDERAPPAFLHRSVPSIQETFISRGRKLLPHFAVQSSAKC